MADVRSKMENRERRRQEVRASLMEDRERRRQEVRASLMANTKKKGFMTPERKKALKQLLRREAASRVKREQEMKAKERQEIISKRIGTAKNITTLDESSLMSLCKEYHNRIYKLQEDKWDLELATGTKELEINELKERVHDQRGKFVVPPLKKVSKYQTQLEKMRQWTYKLAKMDMRGALKPVTKEVNLDEKLPKKENKPEWAASNKQPTTPTTPRAISLIDKNEEPEEEDDEDEDEDEDELDEEVEDVELRIAA